VPIRRLTPIPAALVVVLACLVASPLAAQTSSATTDDAGAVSETTHSRRVAVDRFTGTGDVKAVRETVIAVLEAEVTVDVAPRRLLELNKSVNDGTPQGYTKLADRLDLLALVHGKVGRGDSASYLLALTVISGRDGRSLGIITFKGRNLAELRSTLESDLWDELSPLLERAAGRTPVPVVAPVAQPEPEPQPEPQPPPEPQSESKPPPEPEPEPQPEPPPESRPEPEPRSHSKTCPFLELEAEGGFTNRNFNYTEEESGALRGYRLSGAAYAAAGAAFRPWALSACKFGSGFGVRLRFERLIGAQSTLAKQELHTTGFAYRAEVDFKIPVSLFTFTPHGGFLYREFLLGGNFAPDPQYKVVPLGLDVGFRAAWFFVEAGGAWHFVLDAGSLQGENWFPHAKGQGYQFEGRLGGAITKWLDLFLLAEWESYRFDLEAAPPGAYPNGIAQGSYDKYLRLGGGTRFFLPEHRRRKK
jgi:hypothetical protein